MFQFRPVFLLCILSLPLLSALAWYVSVSNAHKSRIRSEILTGEPSGKLQQLSFSIMEAKGLQWKHKFEFKYKGEMYDIWRTDFFADSVTFHCVKDEKEMYFLREIKKSIYTILGQPASRSNHEKAISHFVKSLYLPPPLILCTLRILPKITITPVTYFKRLFSIFSEVEDKPPSFTRI
ncbi:MAG: hypothetical protein IPN29_16585 [Saprospiraceae bacterium]|nr:hypothetical protein [Saprospiraceae bacterium]